jgi:tripartite-type tricarboxylate transporter receptor subunit TctC
MTRICCGPAWCLGDLCADTELSQYSLTVASIALCISSAGREVSAGLLHALALFASVKLLCFPNVPTIPTWGIPPAFRAR